VAAVLYEEYRLQIASHARCDHRRNRGSGLDERDDSRATVRRSRRIRRRRPRRR